MTGSRSGLGVALATIGSGLDGLALGSSSSRSRPLRWRRRGERRRCRGRARGAGRASAAGGRRAGVGAASAVVLRGGLGASRPAAARLDRPRLRLRRRSRGDLDHDGAGSAASRARAAVRSSAGAGHPGGQGQRHRERRAVQPAGEPRLPAPGAVELLDQALGVVRRRSTSRPSRSRPRRGRCSTCAAHPTGARARCGPSRIRTPWVSATSSGVRASTQRGEVGDAEQAHDRGQHPVERRRRCWRPGPGRRCATAEATAPTSAATPAVAAYLDRARAPAPSGSAPSASSSASASSSVGAVVPCSRSVHISPCSVAITPSISSGLTSTSRAFEPSLGPDHAAALEDVHQPAGLGEADPQLALQHRGRAELRGDDQLDRLDHQVHVVADVVVQLALGWLRRGDVVAVRRLRAAPCSA